MSIQIHTWLLDTITSKHKQAPSPVTPLSMPGPSIQHCQPQCVLRWAPSLPAVQRAQPLCTHREEGAEARSLLIPAKLQMHGQQAWGKQALESPHWTRQFHRWEKGRERQPYREVLVAQSRSLLRPRQFRDRKHHNNRLLVNSLNILQQFVQVHRAAEQESAPQERAVARTGPKPKPFPLFT